MTAFHCVIQISKKKIFIVNKKRPFLLKFSKFSRKSELQLKGNSIELGTFLKYGLTEVKKAPL